jgi:hypothetical protein
MYKDLDIICKKQPNELTQKDLWRLQGNSFYRKAYCIECKSRGWAHCKECKRAYNEVLYPIYPFCGIKQGE